MSFCFLVDKLNCFASTQCAQKCVISVINCPLTAFRAAYSIKKMLRYLTSLISQYEVGDGLDHHPFVSSDRVNSG